MHLTNPYNIFYAFYGVCTLSLQTLKHNNPKKTENDCSKKKEKKTNNPTFRNYIN